jgi:transposase-like protein
MITTQQSTMKVNNRGKLLMVTRRNFFLIQKLAIIDRAKEKGKKPTARELGVSVQLIHRWTRQKQQIFELAKSCGIDDVARKRLNGSGRPSTTTNEVEDALCEWLDHLRN